MIFKALWRLLKRDPSKTKDGYEVIRRWTVNEPERVRTYEEVSKSFGSENVNISISGIREMATSRQNDFLSRLGYFESDLSKGEASALLDGILRPVDYALRQCFSNYIDIPHDDLRKMQIAIVQSDFYTSLPRYGPRATWAELNACSNDPNRELALEERIKLLATVQNAVSAESFHRLKIKGKRKFKAELSRFVTLI